MVTLKSFTRSLEPITVFDDGGLSDVDAVDIVPSSELVSFRTPSRVRAYEDDVTNIVLNGFLGILCDQYTSLDGQNKNKLFQLISSELRKHVRIRPISNAAIQRQVRNSLSRLLQSGANLLSERNIRVTHGRDLAPFMTGQSIDPRSLVRFQQPLSSSSNRLLVQPSLSIVDCIHLCSKLADEFEDIKPLAEGRGAFGKVYMARRKSDDIVYAIKKIKIAADDRYANGMHREVESLSRLSHPNIVRYYDSWQGVEIEQQDSDADSEDESESSQYSSRPKANDGPTLRRYLYIHMELCETTLRCWLMDRVDQDYDKSYEIAKQILEGIMYVHSKNWFHRDLKPLNIFLSGDSPTTVPNIKIGDFGLARQTSSDSYESGASPQVNEFTAKVGTAMYGAPEQLNGSGYSMESDLFSVGLILYELFYLFKTDAEKMKSFDNLRKGKMDKEFESSRPVEAFIIRQLTARDPYSRPSAGEVLDMLGSRRGRDIANADIVSSMQSLSTELSELKIQLQDRDVELSKKDELLMQKDAQILALQERIAEFEALNLL